jgi:hypothetical protein
MNKYNLIVLPVLLLIFILVTFDIWDAYRSAHVQLPTPTLTKFWKYQCVDTMKSSRDLARQHLSDLNKAKYEIETEVKLVVGLGANCISVATPYDREFLPVLKLWVQTARSNGLNVWFRGNFAGWEEWFDYPKISSTAEHLNLTRNFIFENASLFEDGDIFTAAPEAENGGRFVNNNNPSIFPEYRAFLIDQYNLADQAFRELDVKVTTNWFSMNGWIAKNMFDESTLALIDNAVTIDHYTKDLSEMESYIDYFKNTYGAQVNLGEFGAPVPDLNGNMTEREQSLYVSDLMKLFYRKRASISGLNYWTLRFGTTNLVNSDFSTREVYDTLTKYYNPGVVYGRVLNNLGEPIKNVKVRATNYDTTVVTDSNGYYSVQLPSGNTSYTFTTLEGAVKNVEISLLPGERKEYNQRITPVETGIISKIRGLYRGIFSK